MDKEISYPEKEEATLIYKMMLLSRTFDAYVNEKIGAGEEAPHFHSGIGQEALSVAAVRTLRSDDYMIYGHRGYGHLIAKGVPVRTLMLDMMHKVGGSNHGFGGILHVAAPDLGIVGRNGAFGTNFGLGLGLALSAVKLGNGRVALVFYGEAAGARGPLYEALNMAVLWKLPLILIAENNGYSISSRTENLYPGGTMSAVWRGFNIPIEVIDGNDAIAVHAACTRAVARARNGDGPSVIEGLTYRIDPHRPVIDDHLAYRSAEEIESWKGKDPLPRLRLLLEEKRWLAPKQEATWKKQFWEEVDASWALARQAPPPTANYFENKAGLP